MQDSLTAFAAIATLLAAALLSALLIIALGPWLARYAMAEPNVRSSHKLPTPQGGGIAVIGAAIVVSGGALFSSRPSVNLSSLVVISAAVLLIAAIGALADKRPIAAAPRRLGTHATNAGAKFSLLKVPGRLRKPNLISRRFAASRSH